MSFREITELRKAGHLGEAENLARQELEAEPDNIWTKRAMAWVYYDYLKDMAHLESYDVFKNYLIQLKELNLPESEHMVFDQSAWQIGKIVFSIKGHDPIDYQTINELHEMISSFHFTKPSQAYSFLYKAFHKGYQSWSGYLSFANWWNFESFRPEDYLKDEYNGKKIMAMAEQAYIAYSMAISVQTVPPISV